MLFVCPFGMCCKLVVSRTPFFDLLDHKPGGDGGIQVRADGSVLFDDTVREPVRGPLAFVQIAVQGPHDASVDFDEPRFLRRGE